MKMLLSEIDNFPFNPRRGVYHGLAELKESLTRHGQEAPMAVWKAENGRYEVLQGNRRRQAMLEMGWAECDVMVLEFDHAGKALEWLVNQQETTHEFDALEKGIAAADLLKMGISMDDTCRALCREAEQVQLYLALVVMPEKVMKAVRDRRMSLETVGMLKQVEKDDLTAAVQMVFGGIGGDPLTTSHAKALLLQNFIRPKKWAADWLKLARKLKATLSVDGHVYVEFAERMRYTQGDVGHPEDGYEWESTPLRKSLLDDVGTWGDAARLLAVDLYVVAAPEHKNGYVMLADKAKVQQADEDSGGRVFGTVRTVAESGGSLKERFAKTADHSPASNDTAGNDLVPVVDVMEHRVAASSDQWQWLSESELVASRSVLARVQSALKGNINLCRTAAVWKPLESYLYRDVNASALMRDFTGGMSVVDAMAEEGRSANTMRWVILCALCNALEERNTAAVEMVCEQVGVEI